MKKIEFNNIKWIIPLVLFLVLAAHLVYSTLSQRQPTVGGDTNTWGTTLNNYLSVSLNASGSIYTTTNSVFDTNLLFVDAINNKVGIGGISPSTKLQVNGQLNMANNSIKAVKGITVANMNVTGQMDRQLNMGGFLITGGVTGANINATLLNGNTLLELFANASSASNTIGVNDLGNLTDSETWTKINTFSKGISAAKANITALDKAMSTGGFLITGGVTGANINATLLNGNTLLELFANASSASNTIGVTDLGNLTLSNTWTKINTFSKGLSANEVNITGNVGIGTAASSTTPLLVKSTSSVSANLVFDVNNNTASDKLTVLNSGKVGIGVAAPAALLNIAAGTSTANTAPIKLTSGTNLGTAEAGAIEYDGTAFYSTPVASARGVSPSTQFCALTSDFTLTAASGVQSAFPTTCDVWTLAGSTSYFFEGMYIMTTGTTTTKTTALAFALGGGASVTSIHYVATGWNSIADTTNTAQNTVWVDRVASTVLTATATTAGVAIYFQGIIRMNAGGTVTPQIAFSASPGGTNLMKADSYIRFTPIGTNTVASVGNAG